MEYLESMKEFRLKLNLSQKELGDKVGVSEASISNYETGKREPDLKTLCGLADLFDCSLDLLVRGKEKDHSKEWSKKELLNRLEGYDLDELREMVILSSWLQFRKEREQSPGQEKEDS